MKVFHYFLPTISTPDWRQIGKKKPWLSDSKTSEAYAGFRSMNCRLGNRYPTDTGLVLEKCPFCMKMMIQATNNEIHLLVDCPSFQTLRDASGLSKIIHAHRAAAPMATSRETYIYLLDDNKPHHRQVPLITLKFLCSWKGEIEKPFV